MTVVFFKIDLLYPKSISKKVASRHVPRTGKKKGLAHLGAIENDENQTKIRFFDKWAKIYDLRLKFCEFLHQILVIFYNQANLHRGACLSVQMRRLLCTRWDEVATRHTVPSAKVLKRTKSISDFRSKSPYPLTAFEGSSVFLNLSYPQSENITHLSGISTLYKTGCRASKGLSLSRS